MAEQEPPKIEFPCADYPIKIIGRAEPGLRDLVVTIMEKHVIDFDASLVREQGSSKGNFVSVHVVITATCVEQLAAIHEDLMAEEPVKMVL